MPKADLTNYVGREQAYVKHCLLEKYLTPLAYKVGSAWDSIVYIDGFSGPWLVTDTNFADSSFGIAVETLSQAQTGLREKSRHVHMEAILVEQDKDAFARLKTYATANSVADFPVHAIQGEFVAKIPEIDRIVKQRCRNPFRFVFLDPKGWSDIPMNKLKPFLSDRSCEVLINLMTSHIVRFLITDDRATSYHNLFGRQGVLEKLREIPKGMDEQAEQAVREYCRSLRELCKFKYVSSAAVLEPDEESVRYFLVYATNDFHGVEVFKRAEITAAKIQDDIRDKSRHQDKSSNELGLMFEEGAPKSKIVFKLRDRYLGRARKRVLGSLKVSTKSIKYEVLYCMAMSFPLVTPDDLKSWIEGWKPNIEVRLSGSGSRRKLSAGEDDFITVTNRELLK